MPVPTAEELEAEMAALEARRKAAAALLSALRDYEATAAVSVATSVPNGRAKRDGRPPSLAEMTENIATELMEKTNAPVAISDVVEEMTKRGVPVPENNTNNVISARLSNSPKFKGRRGHGY